MATHDGQFWEWAKKGSWCQTLLLVLPGTLLRPLHKSRKDLSSPKLCFNFILLLIFVYMYNVCV